MMAGKKIGAQPGNQNASKGKPWGDALDKALKQYEDKKAGIERGHALLKIANKTIAMALEGDQAAIKEIGDRLDGKPKLTMDMEAKVTVVPEINLVLGGMVKSE
jgi:hypothetical protein